MVTVKHSKVSNKADGTDSSKVRPSDWNADHVIEGLDGLDLADAGTDPGQLPFRIFTVSPTQAKDNHIGDGNGNRIAVDFIAGSAQVNQGDEVTGATSGAVGVVDENSTLDSGTYAGLDAAGHIVFKSVAGGPFVDGEDLEVDSVVVARVDGDPYACYNLSYARGLWIADNLYWDSDLSDGEGMLSRFEGVKDEKSTAIQIATHRFYNEPFKGPTHWRVQGAAFVAANFPANVQVPARMLGLVPGDVGSVENSETWADNGTKASGGSRDELDGDGSDIGYQVRQNQNTEATATELIWYSGFCHNDSDGPSNFPDQPSLRWGIRLTKNIASGDVTLVESVWQKGEPTAGTIVYEDVEAKELWPNPYDPQDPYVFDFNRTFVASDNDEVLMADATVPEYDLSAISAVLVFVLEGDEVYGTRIAEWNDGTANQLLNVSIASGNVVLNVVDGGVFQASMNLGAGTAGRHVVAFRARDNDFAATMDGTACSTDGSGTMPALTTLDVAHTLGPSFEFDNGNINIRLKEGLLMNSTLETYSGA